MAVSLGRIKERIRQEMEVNSDSTTYNGNRLKDMVNEVSLEILEGKVPDEITGRYIQGNIMNFNIGKVSMKIIGPKVLKSWIEPGDAEIFMDTKDLPESWAVLIGDDVVTYTSKTETSLIWCSGITIYQKAGTTVEILYSLPEDFWKPIKAYRRSCGKDVGLIYNDNLNYLQQYYEIKEGYIYYNGLRAEEIYYLQYSKKYQNLENDNDLSVFPDHLALNVIPYICGGRLIKDEVLRIKLLTQGYLKLQTEYAKQGEELGKPKHINWKRYGFSSIR